MMVYYPETYPDTVLSRIVVSSLIAPPSLILNQEIYYDILKINSFSFKTTQFNQWDTEHVVSQSYLLFSCSIYPILSKI